MVDCAERIAVCSSLYLTNCFAMHKVILKNTIFVFTVLSAVSCMRQFAEAAMPEQPQEKESSIPFSHLPTLPQKEKIREGQ